MTHLVSGAEIATVWAHDYLIDEGIDGELYFQFIRRDVRFFVASVNARDCGITAESVV